MTSPDLSHRVAFGRAGLGVVILGVLLYAFVLQVIASGTTIVDYFGFFTNLTSLLAATVLITTGAYALAGRRVPLPLTLARAVVTACMLVVGLIYNVLVPGTGAAPPSVSAVLHVLLPLLMLADWVAIRDHPGIRWSHFWLLLPYPVLWLVVVLIRGVTDGWVPYGFLLPERGWQSIVLTSVGLLLALTCAGGVVWLARQSPRQGAQPGRHSDDAG